ncbi:Hydroperoxide isomerase aloxe3 [Fusarium falciforme]|nr:Hydroperoxide isomerase aloxe3 [Fusarium falciforme]
MLLKHLIFSIVLGAIAVAALPQPESQEWGLEVRDNEEQKNNNHNHHQKNCPDGQFRKGDRCVCPDGQFKKGNHCFCPDDQIKMGNRCFCPDGQFKKGNRCVCPDREERVTRYEQ